MRQIILDTETTGLSHSQGDRLIEIAGIEMIDRRITGNIFHEYINPECEVSAGAVRVHGLDNQFLQDKPKFSLIAEALKQFIGGAELIIHNAAFDLGFLHHEFQLMQDDFVIYERCSVIDTLVLARTLYPGQKNNLDALCKRYNVSNAHRQYHGALLDSELLCEVYLLMTGGQTFLDLSIIADSMDPPFDMSRIDLPVIKATEQELIAHHRLLSYLK